MGATDRFDVSSRYANIRPTRHPRLSVPRTRAGWRNCFIFSPPVKILSHSPHARGLAVDRRTAAKAAGLVRMRATGPSHVANPHGED
jgi:hypothetical protein